MKTWLRGQIVRSLLGVSVMLLAGGVQADNFPSRPLSVIVPFGPGGATDIAARMLTTEAAKVVNVQLVIHNKPGASATIGTSDLYRAMPDGYTLLVGDNISTVFQPLRMSLPYSGPEDFQPIAKVVDIPNVLVVSADSPYKTLNDLVQGARNNPGAIRISTAGPFTGTDLNLRELNHLADVDIEPVPVSGGTGAAVTLMLGGHVDGVVAAPAAVATFVHANKVRPLAVFAKERISLFPDVPTTGELGYDTTMGVMLFISAPKNVDPEVLKTLESAFLQAVNSPGFKEFAQRNGYQVSALNSNEVGQELAEWRRYFTWLAKELDIGKE